MKLIIFLISTEVGVGLLIGLFIGLVTLLANYIDDVWKRKIKKEEVIINKNKELLSSEKKSNLGILNNLKSKGLISSEEFNVKVKEIQNRYSEKRALDSEDYLQLKYLFEKGLFTKEEFESKVILLKQKHIKGSEQKVIFGNLDLSNYSSPDFIGCWTFDKGVINFIDIYNYKINWKNGEIFKGTWEFQCFDNLIVLNNENSEYKLEILKFANSEFVFSIENEIYEAIKTC